MGLHNTSVCGAQIYQTFFSAENTQIPLSSNVNVSITNKLPMGFRNPNRPRKRKRKAKEKNGEKEPKVYSKMDDPYHVTDVAMETRENAGIPFPEVPVLDRWRYLLPV